MSKILNSLKVISAAVAQNDGKPIPENSIDNAISLRRRGYIGCGSSNAGRVAWLTDKAKIELEDAAE